MEYHRQLSRWQVNRQAKIKLEGAVAFMDCQILDINFNGLQIALCPKLPTDKFLNLKIVLSEEHVLDVRVWVVWHKVIHTRNIYGLYFHQMKDSEKEKIYKFIYRYFPEEIKTKPFKDLVKMEGGEIMEEYKFTDRRIFARFEVKFPLRFLNLRQNNEGEAEAQDICAKGVGFVTKERIEPQTPLEMWLQMPNGEEPLYVRGKVVWLSEVEPNNYRVGVDLEKANLLGFSRLLKKRSP